MAYMFGKLAFYVLQPSNLLLILALPDLLAAAWRRRWGLPSGDRRGPRHRLVHAAAGGRLADHSAREPVPGARRTIPRDVDGIVVLGGGVDGDLTRARGQPSFRETMERFAAIPELARHYPQARIVFTGGAAWNSAAGGSERGRRSSACSSPGRAFPTGA